MKYCFVRVPALNKNNPKCSMTIIELTIVIVVLGILLALVKPLLTRAKERAFDKEALVNLELIRHAQEIIFMDNDSYYEETDVDLINENLRLDLNERYWNYNISCTDCRADYEVTADRVAAATGYTRTWNATEDLLIDASCSPTGSCP